jgi:hypothetical protein
MSRATPGYAWRPHPRCITLIPQSRGLAAHGHGDVLEACGDGQENTRVRPTSQPTAIVL